MVHRRSPEKLQERYQNFITYHDDELKETVSLENAVRLQWHSYKRGYELRFVRLEEPVEVGEVLRDGRGRGSLQGGSLQK
jgi:hypothetical protein